MTKEQVLKKHYGSDYYELDDFGFLPSFYNAMQEFSDQELAKERKQTTKLIAALIRCLEYPKWSPDDNAYDTQIIAQKAINEYLGQNINNVKL